MPSIKNCHEVEKKEGDDMRQFGGHQKAITNFDTDTLIDPPNRIYINFCIC